MPCALSPVQILYFNCLCVHMWSSMSIVRELKGAVGGEREVLRNGRGAEQYHKCDLKAEGGGVY